MNTDLRVARRFDLNEFNKIVKGQSSHPFSNPALGICLDTRVIRPGDLFFAIVSNRDGHEFVDEAMSKGAVACVVSRDVEIDATIRVPDTLQALWNYAGWVRNKWGKKIVALSGSNGKTSTKEMIGTLLGDRALKTPGTWNNFLGVPLTLLMFKDTHDFGVIEMGINHFGELLQLCRFTMPNIALLTNIGPAHLEHLHNLDGVAKAKGEIFSQLQSKDIAVLNMDDPKIAEMKPTLRSKIIMVSREIVADIQLLKRTKQKEGHRLNIKYGDETLDVVLNLPGDHNISNYLCALGVMKALEIKADQISANTSRIQQVDMRMQTFELAGGRRLVNDCYNANPGSFQAALQTVSEMKSKRFLVFMGDMLEMGDQAGQIHRDFGKLFSKYGVDRLFVTGAHARDVAQGALQGGLSDGQVEVLEDKSKAAEKILSKFDPGDILLVKASRGMKLEQVVDDIHQKLKG